MTKEGYILSIAQWFTDNEMPKVLPYCAPNVTYISGSGKAMIGLPVVGDFLRSRQRAIRERGLKNYGFPAYVTESPIEPVPVGTPCAALSQFDPYNCTGFMTVDLTPEGLIQKMHFHTEPEVRFHAVKGKCVFTHVPENVRDAILTRAKGFGIIDEHFDVRRHIQRYDVFQQWMRILWQHIYYKLNDQFRQGIENAAGYVYTGAMIEALNRKKPFSVPFSFDPQAACDGVLPDVPDAYREWIRAGYAIGKKLFMGFTEYAELREPKGEAFDDAMMEAYMQMCLYGSIQANKDMDMGAI